MNYFLFVRLHFFCICIKYNKLVEVLFFILNRFLNADVEALQFLDEMFTWKKITGQILCQLSKVRAKYLIYHCNQLN